MGDQRLEVIHSSMVILGARIGNRREEFRKKNHRYC